MPFYANSTMRSMRTMIIALLDREMLWASMRVLSSSAFGRRQKQEESVGSKREREKEEASVEFWPSVTD